MTTVLLLGLLIGMRHALDADHVAAVATLVLRAESWRNCLWQGTVWGIGHTVTLLLLGLVFLFGDIATTPNAEQLLEAGVGVLLILLGLDVARRMWRDQVHYHVHDHEDGKRHFHAHSHRGEARNEHAHSRHQHQHRAAFPVKALLIGLMHGLAGSAVLVILALDTSHTLWQCLAYMTLFGLGSIAGMAILSVVIAVPLRRSGNRLNSLHRRMEGLVSMANLGLGGFLLYGALTTAA